MPATFGKCENPARGRTNLLSIIAWRRNLISSFIIEGTLLILGGALHLEEENPYLMSHAFPRHQALICI